MESVDAMSAAELRTKLAEFGFPVMPITASTRALMAKKLKMLLAGQQRQQQGGGGNDSAAAARRSLARHSSGEEESDLEVAAPKRRVSKAAAAAAPVVMAPPAVARKSSSRPPKERPTPPPPPVAATTRDEYETGSDSDGADAAAPRPFVPRGAVGRRGAAESTPLPAPMRQSTHKSEDLDAIRRRLGLPTSASDATGKDDYDSPYLSDFTRRLSALQAAADPDASNGRKGGYAFAARRRDASPDLRAAGEKNVSKNNLVSLAIVGVGVAFFALVAFAYVGMKNEAPFDDDPLGICTGDFVNRKPGVDCVAKTRSASAIDLLKMLRPELKSRAVDAACSVAGRTPYMLEDDVVDFVRRAYPDKNGTEIVDDIYNAQVLAVNNPKWGVALVRLEPEDSKEPSTVFKSVDYIAPLRGKRRVAFVALNPSPPLRCLLYDKLYVLGATAVGLAFLTVAVQACREGFKAYRSYRKRRDDEVYATVERIVEYLSSENDDDEAVEARPVPVNHVRDALVPPQRREKQAQIWKAAVEYLKEHESRVRFDTDTIAGEEYQTVRWVSPRAAGPKAPRGAARAWQGQAFETQRGSVNNLGFSPTSCLKIRHMVEANDKNPNLGQVVRDAILEKCGPQCRILHVEIDKTSCCVFVKCASPTDAGIVYRSLHGWWYEGNLITVKFLRLERYMDHFPLSPSDGPYLKPSAQ